MREITLDSLVSYVGTHPIEEAYQLLGYDYAAETPQVDACDPARARFVKLVAWRSTPTLELVRRFFNQLNTAYAEQLLFAQPHRSPREVLLEANRLTLYRQNKSVGFRKNTIGFGYPVDLPFGHEYRRYKWLYGIEPVLLESATDQWCETIDKCRPTLDTAIALTMALIAIHPFSDANGRVARLVFTWLCKRWKLNILWLGESPDGELRRTGHTIHSTEYLMAIFMFRLMDWHNKIDPPGCKPSAAAETRMFEILCRELTNLRSDAPEILDSEQFLALKKHLELEQHFRKTSPRFDCLRGAIS